MMMMIPAAGPHMISWTMSSLTRAWCLLTGWLLAPTPGTACSTLLLPGRSLPTNWTRRNAALPPPLTLLAQSFGEFWSNLSSFSVQRVFCWVGRFQEQLIDYWSGSTAPPFATDNQLLNLFIFCIWRLCFIFDHTWNTIPSTVLICKIWISLMSVKPVVASLKIVPFPFDAQECAILWYTVHRRRCHTFWCTGGAGYIVPYCTILCTEELPIFLLLHRRNCYTIITVLFCAQEEEPYLSFWCTGGAPISHISHID